MTVHSAQPLPSSPTCSRAVQTLKRMPPPCLVSTSHSCRVSKMGLQLPRAMPPCIPCHTSCPPPCTLQPSEGPSSLLDAPVLMVPFIHSHASPTTLHPAAGQGPAFALLDAQALHRGGGLVSSLLGLARSANTIMTSGPTALRQGAVGVWWESRSSTRARHGHVWWECRWGWASGGGEL